MTARTRPVEYEINDLAVRLEDGGLSARSARIEAERIAASIWNAALEAAADTVRPDGVSYANCCDEHAARNESRKESADEILELKRRI
jgi:hypothetical protein